MALLARVALNSRIVGGPHSFLNFSTNRKFSSENQGDGESKPPKKVVYEYREYQIKPDEWENFNKLTKEKIQRRFDVSKCNIYLRPNEITRERAIRTKRGYVYRVVHIWQYESLDERSRVRKQLSEDKVWISGYLQPALKYMVSQKSFIIQPVAGFLPRQGSPELRYFAIRKFHSRPGEGSAYCRSLAKFLERQGVEAYPLGVWMSEFGELDSTIELYGYQHYSQGFRHQMDLQECKFSGARTNKRSTFMVHELADWSQWSHE